jgi:hypothetical protein
MPIQDISLGVQDIKPSVQDIVGVVQDIGMGIQDIIGVVQDIAQIGSRYWVIHFKILDYYIHDIKSNSSCRSTSVSSISCNSISSVGS